MSFDTAVAVILEYEGGLSTTSADPGNWTGGKVGVGVNKGTNFGISSASFPTLDIAHLTVDQAKAIYRSNYWLPIAGDSLPDAIALVTFDCAVNQGVRAAKIMLQVALGVAQDGAIGPLTIAAARKVNDVDSVVDRICAARACRYAAGNMSTFGTAWMLRLFDVANKAHKLT